MKDEFTIWLRVGDNYDTIGFPHHTPVSLEHPARCSPNRQPSFLHLKDVVDDERFKSEFLVHTKGGWEVATFDNHKYIHGKLHIQTDTLPRNEERRELVEVLNRAFGTDELKRDLEQLGLSNLYVSVWLNE